MYYLILLNKGLKEKEINHMFNKLELLHREARKI